MSGDPLEIQFGKIHAVPVVIQHQAPGEFGHGLKAGRIFERHVIAPIHDGRMAAGRHFAPLRVLVPELRADHGIFQPGVHRDPFLMGGGEETRDELPKTFRTVKSPQMDLADRPTLQLRHHRRRVDFGFAAGVEIYAEIIRGHRGGDVQLIDDGLRQERQVLENHPFLRLKGDSAVDKLPLPTASRDHQRGMVLAGRKPKPEVQGLPESAGKLIGPADARGLRFSNVVAFFIILTAAATLHARGISDIQTADQAALALKPLAGRFTFLLFAAGIVGTGLLAVPVLAGSAAYGVSEAFQWTASMQKKPRQAMRFYGTIGIATLIGLVLNFIHLSPIKALFWSAILNGIVAAPVMAFMMILTHNPKVMGKFTLPPYLRFAGWFATAVMLSAALGMILTIRP